MSSDRGAQKEVFLKSAGWSDAVREPIAGDASTRSYERLSQGGQRAVLMNAPKDAETPIAGPGASAAERQALGYNAMARLAGPNIEAFAAIAQELSTRGFSAPKILAADLESGFLLLEDFGASVYAGLLQEQPDKESELYGAAVDMLAALYRCSFPRDFTFGQQVWPVLDYDETAMLAEVDLCPDWFAKDTGRAVPQEARDAYHALWREAFAHLRHHPPGLGLRDVHAENLFWLPERQATSRVGLIDFQDALFVHPAYDLVSLLEDARRDVSLDIPQPMVQRFCDKSGLIYDEAFAAAYAVMGAQRNTKIIGIFVRLALRDNKPHYRDLIPRVRAHLQRNLSHPVLNNIGGWFENYIPEVLND